MLQIFQIRLRQTPCGFRRFSTSPQFFDPFGIFLGAKASNFQRVPDFFSGCNFPVQPVIVGVDAQGHVHRAVSGQILNFLDVQPRLKETGYIGVPIGYNREVSKKFVISAK